VERIIAPDSTSLADYMLARLTGLVSGLVVRPERMARNVELTGGLHNSQELLLKLCDKGLSRVEAYAPVQRDALEAHRLGADFKALVTSDPDITAHLSPAEIEAVFSPERFTASVDAVFTRVFA
jgi:adenylosuccinate lyase